MTQHKTILRSVPLWDLPTRLFHWLLVISLLAAWYFAEYGPLRLHYLSGLVIIGLLAFRLLWGLFGSPSARFARFVRHPRDAVAYLREVAERRPSYSFGHNAAGGLMVVALMIVVILQAGTGLFSSNYDNFDGPLYDLVPAKISEVISAFHAFNFNLILGLAGLHILAILFYRFWKGENLVRAMITGRAHLPPHLAEAAAADGHTAWAPFWRVLPCVVLAAALPIWIYFRFPLQAAW